MKREDKNSNKFKTGARQAVTSVDVKEPWRHLFGYPDSRDERLKESSLKEHHTYLKPSNGVRSIESLKQSGEKNKKNRNNTRRNSRKGRIIINAMTKIARGNGKSLKRRSSVLIQFYSKLRKREESSGSVVQHAGNGNAQQQNCANHQHGCVQHGAVLQQAELTVIAASPQQPAEPPPFLWVYSPSNHSLDTQVHHSQDLLVRPDSFDVMDGECKNGLRKNLRGKWNRLVKKKPHHEIYTIPAELRPQLKQIYVY